MAYGERIVRVVIDLWPCCDRGESGKDGYATLTHDGADIFLRSDGESIAIRPQSAVALGHALIAMGKALEEFDP